MPPAKKLVELRNKLSTGALQKGNFARNVLTITTGTALSQAIAIASLPILSRMYSPAAFGLLATFIVLCDTSQQFACLGYQGSVVLPKRDRTAHMLWVACIGIGLAVCIAAEIIFLWLGEDIASLLGNPGLEPYLWLVPVVMFLWVGFETTSNWCARHKQFGHISTGIVSNRIAAVGAQLALGAFSATAQPSGLIAGNVFGSFAGLTVLVGRGTGVMQSRYWKTLRASRIFLLLYRYRHFPGYGLLSSIMAAAWRALPVIFLGYFFTPAIVGFFAMANRLVGGPIQLLTTAVVRVFYERANRAKHDGDLGQLTVELYERLVALAMAPLGLLGLAAPNLVALLLGDQWVQTGIFLQYLVIWLFFVTSISTLNKIFFILERQRELAAINVVQFLVSTGALLVGGFYGDANLTVIFFTASSSLVRIGEGMRIMFITGAPVQALLMAVAKEIIIATPFLTVMAATRYFINDNLVVTSVFLVLLILFVAFRAKALVATRQK